MNNQTTSINIITVESDQSSLYFRIISYFALIIILMAILGNTTTFFIFRCCNEFKKMSSMIYLSFISIVDMFACMIWNLDHYVYPQYGVRIEELSEISCRILTFVQYFTLQSSSLLLTFMCIDRFVTVMKVPGSILTHLPFGTKKSALNFSWLIVTIIAIFNFHLVIFDRKPIIKLHSTGNLTQYEYSFDCFLYANGFEVYPVWDRVNIIVYNLVPFIIMSIFNGLLIRNIYHIQKTSKNIAKKKVRLTISIICLTFLFLTMTIPGTIFFAFIGPWCSSKFCLGIGYLIDYFSFLYHSSLFIICYVTNNKFRKVTVIFIRACLRIKFAKFKKTSTSINYKL